MSTRVVPASRQIALVFRENLLGFAALIALAGAFYGLYGLTENGIDDWMNTGARLVVAFVPVVVVGSLREAAAGGRTLWLQKPVDPARLYFARFLHVAFVAVASTVLFRCAAAAVGLAAGWAPGEHPLQPLPIEAVTAFVVVAVGFGLSCWWGNHCRSATVAYLSFSVAVLLQIDLLQPEASAGFWGRVVRAVLFPFGARREVGSFLAGSAEPDWRPVVWLLAYTAAWLVVGVIGITTRGVGCASDQCKIGRNSML